MAAKKREGRKYKFTLMLTKSEEAALKKLAVAKGLSASGLTRMLILEAVKQADG